MYYKACSSYNGSYLITEAEPGTNGRGSLKEKLPVKGVELLGEEPGADRGGLLKEELRVEGVELLGEEPGADRGGSLKEEL